MSGRAPEELQEEIEVERRRLAEAAQRLRSGVESVALPRRIPWVLVATAFLAGLALGAIRRRRGACRRESTAGS